MDKFCTSETSVVNYRYKPTTTKTLIKYMMMNDKRENSMKVLEAVEVLRKHFHFREEMIDDSFWGRCLQLQTATLGESRWEKKLEMLEHSHFGRRFFESYSNGGGYEFRIPEKVFEDEMNDPFQLIMPSLDPMAPFYNSPDRKVVVRQRTVLEYEYENTPRELLQRQIQEALREIEAKFGSRTELVKFLQENGLDMDKNILKKRLDIGKNWVEMAKIV